MRKFFEGVVEVVNWGAHFDVRSPRWSYEIKRPPLVPFEIFVAEEYGRLSNVGGRRSGACYGLLVECRPNFDFMLDVLQVFVRYVVD